LPKLMRQRLDRRRRGQRPEDRPRGIAGQHLSREEHDHAQNPERDQAEADALEEEDEH
jgi:hypothetical protein